jgi:hypothetical protein
MAAAAATTTTKTPQQQDSILMQSWIWSMLLHIVTLNSVLLNLHLRASMHTHSLLID